jgi:hypothetical protein
MLLSIQTLTFGQIRQEEKEKTQPVNKVTPISRPSFERIEDEGESKKKLRGKLYLKIKSEKRENIEYQKKN